MPAIWLIGDSTVEDNRPPFRGWGWALPEFVREDVTVHNHALSGRSSRSFMAEGLFEPIRRGMQPGDLLLIQFGHNDEKDTPELHTDPASTFPECLEAYCAAALEAGATPVLVTPVCRRIYTGGGDLLYTHGEYPAAIRRLAQAKGYPLVDLKAASRQMYLSLGEAATAELFVRLEPGGHPDFPDGHDDRTHFNAEGARKIAALAADLLRQDARCREYMK